MEERYMRKYTLLLEKYMEIDNSNEKLQNRICHIRKQIRYLRRLKRLLIQKLVVYGDRFMDVCLEIPDMEPGANVEDQIIRRVAEVPHPPTPPHPPPAPVARSSTINLGTGGSSVGSTSGSANAGPPAKKRRRTTATQDDGSASLLHSPTLNPNEPAPSAILNRSTSSHRKSVTVTSSSAAAATSSIPPKLRPEPVEGPQPMLSAPITVQTIPQPHQVSASVEDVVNSVVFDCQQWQGKEIQGGIKDETVAADPILSVASISANVSEVFQLLPSTRAISADVHMAPVLTAAESQHQDEKEPRHDASNDQV